MIPEMTMLDANINHIFEYILPRIRSHRDKTDRSLSGDCDDAHSEPSSPYILALTGLQGSGKSTWASKLVTAFSVNAGLRAITVSLDDFYRDHAGLVSLTRNNPGNALLRTRGQPGTHDEELANDFFKSLAGHSRRDVQKQEEGEILIPSFDKSRFNGEGDRVSQQQWKRVTSPDVVIFEGWCLGFQPLSEDEVRQKWEEVNMKHPQNEIPTASSHPTVTLLDHPLPHLQVINRNLQRYCESFMGPQHFDYLLHLDTDNLVNVYVWRLEQEHALRGMKGFGMADEEVVSFVKGYMPAYELYLDQLRQGFFGGQREGADRGTHGGKGQLRVVMDRKRTVVEIEEIL